MNHRLILWGGILLLLISQARADSLSLHGEHRFQHGDDLQWSEPDLDDEDWQQVNLPGPVPLAHSWAGSGFGWYRIRFQLDDPRDRSLYLGQINTTDEVYLNGYLIGRTGQLDPVAVYAPPRIRCYHLPEHLLRPSGEVNLLAIRVFSQRAQLGLADGPVEIGPREELEQLADQTNLILELTAEATWMLALTGLISLIVIGLRGGASRQNAWMIALLAAYLLYLPFESQLFVDQNWRNHPLSVGCFALLLTFLIMAVVPVTLEVLSSRMRWWLWFAMGTLVMGVLVFLAGGTPDVRSAQGLVRHTASDSLVTLSVLIIGFHLLILCVGKVLHGRRDARILGIFLTLAMMVFLLSFEEITSLLGINSVATYLLASASFPLLFTGLLVASFDRSLRDRVRLARLGSRVVHAQNEERNRIGRQLHDGVTQDLIAVRLGLQRASAGGEGNRAIQPALDSLQNVIEQVRTISHEMRPGQLEGSTLVEAFQRHAMPYPSVELKVEADSDASEGFSEDEKLQLFRIFQEAFSNAVRHGEATIVQVLLQIDLLSITDNGHGRSPGRRSGVGLSTMRERAELLGAGFHVRFVEGSGVTVEVRLGDH